MNKQELIERIEDFPCEASLVTEMIRINKNTLLGWVKELDEPQKPVVPQFVADWYEEHKDDIDYNIWEWFVHGKEKEFTGYRKKFLAWLNSARGNPVQTLVNMHQFGYTVEIEKRYYVRFKWIEESYSYLTLIKHLNTWTLTNIKLDKKFRSEHTKKQLEEAGFGWVFDCPGIEIEEVE